MTRRLKATGQVIALACVAGLLALLVWSVVHQQHAPGVGATAPAFTLRRLEGPGKVSLASFRGKTVVLNFFASWCAPCKREAPDLESIWRHHRSDGLVVLGVDSGDTKGAVRSFLRAHGVTYPIAFDPGQKLALGAYALPGLPVTYVINPAGRIVGERLLGPVSDSGYRQLFSRELKAALRE